MDVARYADWVTRASMAAGTLGLDGTAWVPVLGLLGEEFARCMGVRLAGDLGTLALVTRCDVERVRAAAAAAGRERVEEMTAGVSGEVLFEVRLGRYGLRLGIERAGGDGPPALVERMRSIAERAELVSDERRGVVRVWRLGALLPAGAETGARLAAAMAAGGVEPRQRDYLSGVYPVLSEGAPWVCARVAATQDGVLPEVGVSFPGVKEDLLLHVWGTLRRGPDLPKRLGTVTGALAVDRALFEVRVAAGAPDVEATFVMSGSAPPVLGI